MILRHSKFPSREHFSYHNSFGYDSFREGILNFLEDIPTSELFQQLFVSLVSVFDLIMDNHFFIYVTNFQSAVQFKYKE